MLFNSGLDIHNETAVKLFGVNEAQSKRHIAKSINFGILYGMGSSKLAKMLNIKAKEAKEIIDKYFQNFQQSVVSSKKLADDSEKFGFVETLLGRRRYFNYEGLLEFRRLGLHREAVNTKFQGSAADLIKLSMNKIFDEIKNRNYDARIVLQIHDELIFEVNNDKVDEYRDIFKGIMENIYPKLKVKLECSSKISKNLKMLSKLGLHREAVNTKFKVVLQILLS